MDMKQMMRQAQKMQKELNKAQEEIATMSFEATAGGGMVTAVASGDMAITSLTIDPDAVDPEDVEMLQDMVVVSELSNQRMSAVTGGMNIPGLM